MKTGSRSIQLMYLTQGLITLSIAFILIYYLDQGLKNSNSINHLYQYSIALNLTLGDSSLSTTKIFEIQSQIQNNFSKIYLLSEE